MYRPGPVEARRPQATVSSAHDLPDIAAPVTSRFWRVTSTSATSRVRSSTASRATSGRDEGRSNATRSGSAGRSGARDASAAASLAPASASAWDWAAPEGSSLTHATCTSADPPRKPRPLGRSAPLATRMGTPRAVRSSGVAIRSARRADTAASRADGTPSRRSVVMTEWMPTWRPRDTICWRAVSHG